LISGLQLDPANPHLNSNLAQAYLEECNYATAEYYARVAISNSNDSAKVILVWYKLDKTIEP
jgi:Tfp pilus assembly protein PilF